MSAVRHGPRGFGADVEAEIVLCADTFSIRYDMDRETGVISRKSHALEGRSLAGTIVYFPGVQGAVWPPARRSSPSVTAASRRPACSSAEPIP